MNGHAHHPTHPPKNNVIQFSQALALALNAAAPRSEERVPLHRSLNRILAADIIADIAIPPFNKAAVDGYACRRKDLRGTLTIIEEAAAGVLPTKQIGRGECTRIMTGAPVPRGADCVVMVEQAEVDIDGRIRFFGETRDNICAKGQDIRPGELVLQRGVRILPAHIAVLATVGCASVPVYRQPTIGVLATGNELVDPSQKPLGAQIRNSNSAQLIAQLLQMGIEAVDIGVIGDDRQETKNAIHSAMSRYDVMLLSGGVSMGAYDFVPSVLEALGFSILFDRVAMQPGKPTVFSQHKDGTYCVGLPGNPVSTFVVFELLLKPFIYALMGHHHTPKIVSAVFQSEYRRKKGIRQSTLPVRFVAPDSVELLDYHGSAHIHALCRADGLITLPAGQLELKKGYPVNVRCL